MSDYQKLNRRHFGLKSAMLGCSAFGVSSLSTGTAWAQRKDSPDEKTPDELVTPAAKRAIERGLKFLDRRQIKSGREKGSFGRAGYAGGVAVCGLGGLAFMCNGSAPGDGPYGKQIDRCVDFLLANTRDTGYIARINGTGTDNMYGHGFGMLFLAEAYGMTQKAKIGEKLRKAVKLTVKTQNNAGGWRYQPIKSDADLSITICQIMGLRAARDAGIDVPDETRKACIKYVKKSQNSDGGFRYTIGGGGSSFALTAAGICSLYSSGVYDGKPIEKGLAYLMRYKPGKSSYSSYYFYANYYAVQAMWHAGGKHWNEWYPLIRDELLKKQGGDGSWNDQQVGQEFGTAMACIILQMPYNYLPVFSP